MPETSRAVPIFDGHNDTLLDLAGSARSFFERSESGHIDLPRARAGNLAGGFFAVFVPDPAPEAAAGGPAADNGLANSIAAGNSIYAATDTMPAPMALEYAQQKSLATIASFLRLEQAYGGQVRVCRTAAEIQACIEGGVFAMELHMEGAEAIDPGLDMLDVLHAAGLRSLGICWSRPNRFGHGVPFAFPSTGDTGPGLSELGIALVQRCNALRVMIDLSHLNEAGFWDVAKHSCAPLVATHSNVHAICASARNLSDRQLDAIRDSDGLVGLNFHVGFLRPDGGRDADIVLDILVDHLDVLLQRLGPTRVALGSDFDGATMPAAICDAAGLPALLAAMRSRGYSEDIIEQIAWRNWIRVLRQTWGE